MKINNTKIWREIGDAFATPYGERTGWQKNITCFGLCWAFWKIARKFQYDKIGHIGNEMGIGTHWWPDRDGTYSKGFTDSIDRERATFAYFMAELGNKGYEELIKGCD